MRKEIAYKTAVCGEYERLLKECQANLEIWEQRRNEICDSRSSSKQAGAELLRLQANFAKSYAVLRRHVDECDLCQFVSKVGGRESLGTLVSTPHVRVVV